MWGGAVSNRAIPFNNIHTPLLTRLLILDPFMIRNGFPEDPLGNSLFFVEPPRKFTIFLKPFGNNCWRGSIMIDPLGNVREFIDHPFGNFRQQVYLPPPQGLF
jgi:hypothetical protein